MATTITAATIAPVLREAADHIAALGYVRVLRHDVYNAIHQSAPTYDIADAALNSLAAQLPDATWLTTTSEPHSRDEVAAEIRAAAETAGPMTFDWTDRRWLVPVQVPGGTR